MRRGALDDARLTNKPQSKQRSAISKEENHLRDLKTQRSIDPCPEQNTSQKIAKNIRDDFHKQTERSNADAKMMMGLKYVPTF